jgi:hypothetical protein
MKAHLHVHPLCASHGRACGWAPPTPPSEDRCWVALGPPCPPTGRPCPSCAGAEHGVCVRAVGGGCARGYPPVTGTGDAVWCGRVGVMSIPPPPGRRPYVLQCSHSTSPRPTTPLQAQLESHVPLSHAHRLKPLFFTPVLSTVHGAPNPHVHVWCLCALPQPPVSLRVNH